LRGRASTPQTSQSENVEADDAAYEAARGANTVAAYSAYLASYPAGRHVTEANNARASLAAASSQATLEPYRVHVCNKSSRNVAFAAVFQPADNGSVWKHQGWWRVAPNDCAYIFQTNNPSFAIRAESLDDSTTWAGTGFQQCFINPGPYEFTNTDGTVCPSNATMKTAYKLTATNRGDWTWSVGN
jgi:uncharacterized membrane protein